MLNQLVLELWDSIHITGFHHFLSINWHPSAVCSYVQDFILTFKSGQFNDLWVLSAAFYLWLVDCLIYNSTLFPFIFLSTIIFSYISWSLISFTLFQIVVRSTYSGLNIAVAVVTLAQSQSNCRVILDHAFFRNAITIVVMTDPKSATIFFLAYWPPLYLLKHSLNLSPSSLYTRAMTKTQLYVFGINDVGSWVGLGCVGLIW